MKLGRQRINLSNEVAEFITGKIYRNELKAGEKIIVASIAEEAGVSGTPVKEALKQLQGQNLVELKSRRGFFVTTISEKDIDNIFEARMAIELFCVEKVLKEKPDRIYLKMKKYVDDSAALIKDSDYWDVERYMEDDYNFHYTYVKEARNDRLIQMYQQLNVHIQINRVLYTAQEKRAKETQQAHQDILSYFKEQDIDQVRESIKNHIYMTWEHVKKIYKRRLLSELGRNDLIGVNLNS